MNFKQKIVLVISLFALTYTTVKAQNEVTENICVDDIITNYHNAIGGLSEWRNVETLILYEKQLFSGTEIPTRIYMKKPQMYKMEIKFAGDNTVQAFDGETAWGIHPQSGGRATIASSLERNQIINQSKFYNRLLFYKEEGYVAELLSKQIVNERETYEIRLSKNLEEVFFYIDTQTYFLLLEKYLADTPGLENKFIELFYDDYSKEGNIMMYHSIKRVTSGVTNARWRIERVEINTPLSDDIFRFPSR